MSQVRHISQKTRDLQKNKVEQLRRQKRELTQELHTLLQNNSSLQQIIDQTNS